MIVSDMAGADVPWASEAPSEDSAPAEEQIFRYVPHADVQRRMAEGWVVADDLAGTNHGWYSVLMQWQGAGEPT